MLKIHIICKGDIYSYFMPLISLMHQTVHIRVKLTVFVKLFVQVIQYFFSALAAFISEKFVLQ